MVVGLTGARQNETAYQNSMQSQGKQLLVCGRSIPVPKCINTATVAVLWTSETEIK